MDYLATTFDSLGVDYIPSYTNFITTLWPDSDKADLISKRLLEKGVIVRNLSSFGWQNSIRISIGTEKENDILVNALKSSL